MHIVEFYKGKVIYNKPVYAGTSILDISKVCMMDFHYNVIHKNFNPCYNLVYSDTDSLIYSIQHEDIYEWIKVNKHYFDLSDSVRPELQDKENKKVYGTFKDITHENYVNTLQNNDSLARNVTRIMSKDQQLYTIEQPKVDLTSFYDKMKFLNPVQMWGAGWEV